MEEQKTLTGALVTGNFTITATMPQGKNINVCGYLYEGESIESVNARVNVFHDIVDFQRTRSEIPELQLKLDGSIRRLDEIRGHYTVLLDKQNKGGKISSQEKQALAVMDINVAKHLEDIEDGKKAVADAKLKVGM
jgi:hypothetical protein